LATRGGIWEFAADKTGQAFPADGLRFATGLRDMQALDWNPADRSLYNVMQGRNKLNEAGARLYTEEDSERGVADPMHRITRNANLGWPYTHFDPRTMKRMQAPEYGGKPGDVVTDNAYSTPVAAFAAHSSPLDIAFYNATRFPASYRGGAFVALHGGADGERDQVGYKVMFVPRPPAKGFAKPVVFADGFAGGVRRSEVAEFRPSAVAVAPNGGLYVMESEKGRIWRIDYVGTGKGRAAKPMVTARR
jgi:glucose/arabinose dehydrogenase